MEKLRHSHLYPAPWQSVEEVAVNIGFSRRAILYWAERGEFPSPRKIRGKLRWRWSEVDAWMSRSGQNPPATNSEVSDGVARERAERAAGL
jgi:excisionase family DNA binding protein